MESKTESLNSTCGFHVRGDEHHHDHECNPRGDEQGCSWVSGMSYLKSYLNISKKESI